MKRFLLIGVICWNVCSLWGINQDSVKVEKWLYEAVSLPRDSCRILHFARQMLGVPYVAGTLDGSKKEQLVTRVDALDCTTFVETVMALCIADKRRERTFESFKKALTEIRYRDGILNGYTSRLHYFSDWIHNNEQMGFVKECTSETSCSRLRELELDFMSTHSDSYLPMQRDSSLIGEIIEMEKAWKGIKVAYIPKSVLCLSSDELNIKNGDILAITTNIKGLDVVHVGFASWKGNKLHLLHASSIAKKVIDDSQTLYKYSQNKKAHTGVRAIRFIY